VTRVGECAGVSVLVVASTDGSGWIALLSDSLTSLVVLGRYGLCSYWELHLALRCVIRSMVSAHALSVVADRCDSKAP